MKTLALLLSVSLILMACGSDNTDTTTNPVVTATPSTRLNLIQQMESHDAGSWQISDGWSNGSPFISGWCSQQLRFSNSSLYLDIENLACSGENYASGEYRTINFYGYGYYEARFKPASGAGIVTGMFTYTGPSDSNPHDEIDIEILGSDTSKMQVNYWSNGVEHPVVINLGFDAAASLHTYAFEWSSGAIKWYVDNQLVHTEDGSNGALPTTPGRLMINSWACDAVSWCGTFNPSSLPETAQFDWLGYGP